LDGSGELAEVDVGGFAVTHKELLRLLESEGWVLRRAKTVTHMAFCKEGVVEILTVKDRALKEKIPKGCMARIRKGCMARIRKVVGVEI
jgi:predicted RNA binding protein YcfA (HicA-like mRNA interferase family)